MNKIQKREKQNLNAAAIKRSTLVFQYVFTSLWHD